MQLTASAGVMASSSTRSPDKLAMLRPSVTPLARSCESAAVQCKPRRDAAVQFGAINEQNVEQLQQLNVAIFPVRYNDVFYCDVLRTPRQYTKFAYVDGCVVGAICCRLEPLEHCVTGSRQRTYIMTLGVLASHRKCHIGSQLLASVIEQSRRDGVEHIYLHVQTSNAVALQFYRSFGFEVAETIRNYYKRIEPPDCFVLRKLLSRETVGVEVAKTEETTPTLTPTPAPVAHVASPCDSE